MPWKPPTLAERAAAVIWWSDALLVAMLDRQRALLAQGLSKPDAARRAFEEMRRAKRRSA